MDATLQQILGELFRSHMTIDSLTAQLTERDQRIADLETQLEAAHAAPAESR